MNIVNETGASAQVQAVRDHRGKGWFWADHEVIDIYGPHVGVYGIGVYMYLARRVDDTLQRCWPSYQTIADALDISRPKAIDAVQDLVACGLIAIEPREIEGHQSSNYFILLPRESWVTVENIQLPSRAKKQKKSGALKSSSRGKQDLPHGKQDLLPGKRRGTQGLPKQETSKQETIKKKQQAEPAEFENSLSAGRLEALTNSLIQLRLEPNAARRLAAQYPERCETAATHWAARGFDGINKPAGAVRSSIEQPDKWPEIYQNPPDDTLSVAPAKPRLSAAERRKKYAQAYDAVWQAMKPGERDAAEREGKDRFEYIERIHGDELALAMRQG